MAAGDSDDDEVVAIEGVDVDEEGDGVADEVPLTARAVLRITFPWKVKFQTNFKLWMMKIEQNNFFEHTISRLLFIYFQKRQTNVKKIFDR